MQIDINTLKTKKNIEFAREANSLITHTLFALNTTCENFFRHIILLIARCTKRINTNNMCTTLCSLMNTRDEDSPDIL